MEVVNNDKHTSLLHCSMNMNNSAKKAYSVVSYSDLFTLLVGWHASAVSLPSGDVIFTPLACPPEWHLFLLHQK
jgi:hypothetical protein